MLCDGRSSALDQTNIKYLLWFELLHRVSGDRREIRAGFHRRRYVLLELGHMDHWMDLGIRR